LREQRQRKNPGEFEALVLRAQDDRNEMHTKLANIVNDKITKFKFQKQEGIIGKYKRLAELRTFASERSSTGDFEDDGKWEGLCQHGRQCNVAVNTIESEMENFESSILGDLQPTVGYMLSNPLQKLREGLSTQFNALEDEISAIAKARKSAERSQKRKVLIALEKRIYDIQSAVLARRTETTQDIVCEYREELFKIFLRYAKYLAERYPDISDGGGGESIVDLESIWQNKNPTHEYRIKFILSFLERTSADPTVITKLYQNVFKYYI